jgi:hypothetical protein
MSIKFQGMKWLRSQLIGLSMSFNGTLRLIKIKGKRNALLIIKHDMKLKNFFAEAFKPLVFRRALRVELIVGVLLNIIN